jgi:hypothetical protein
MKISRIHNDYFKHPTGVVSGIFPSAFYYLYYLMKIYSLIKNRQCSLAMERTVLRETLLTA